MVRRIIFILMLLGIVPVAYSQSPEGRDILPGIIVNNDTIPHKELAPIFVYPPRDGKSRRLDQQYWRLAQKVKKVYPYAKRASELLREYNAKFLATQDKKLQRKYLKQTEEQLFREYGPQLKKLTISEGRILIKLIDRETGETSYELIKELKGGLTAFFWQGVARVFGNDLKSEYDPNEEDRMIEEIIWYIEAGLI